MYERQQLPVTVNKNYMFAGNSTNQERITLCVTKCHQNV